MLPNWPWHVPATMRTLFLQVSFLAGVQRSQDANNSQTVDVRAAACQWPTDAHPVQGLKANRSFPTLGGSVKQWDRWWEIPAGNRALCLLQFSLWRTALGCALFCKAQGATPDQGGASSSSPALPFPSLRPASPSPAGSTGVPREKHDTLPSVPAAAAPGGPAGSPAAPGGQVPRPGPLQAAAALPRAGASGRR